MPRVDLVERYKAHLEQWDWSALYEEAAQFETEEK